MSTNKSLLRKADLAIADLQANGGELLPEQAARFIRKLIITPTILNRARVVEMNSPKRKINKIGFGKRILRKAISATALTQSQRSKPTTEQIELSSKEQIAEVRLPYDVLEDNIESATAANNEPSNTGPGGLRRTLIEMIAERTATDLEELGLLGDTDYTNPADPDDEDFLSQLDGWLKVARLHGHVVDNGNAPISRTMFKKGVQALPDQYLRVRPDMSHFVSVDNETEYRDQIADRPTNLGDSKIQGRDAVFAFGAPINPVPMMPASRGLFVNPLNLLFGIQRQISMEFDKDITARVYIIVVTCRVDFQIEEADAVVEYENIGVA